MRVTLKDARARAGLSQEAVAKQIGVSAVMLSKYENGRAGPSAQVFMAMCRLYGVNPRDVDLESGKSDPAN